MCCMQARAKHDTVNTVTAGCVTGGSMSARGIYLSSSASFVLSQTEGVIVESSLMGRPPFLSSYTCILYLFCCFLCSLSCLFSFSLQTNSVKPWFCGAYKYSLDDLETIITDSSLQYPLSRGSYLVFWLCSWASGSLSWMCGLCCVFSYNWEDFWPTWIMWAMVTLKLNLSYIIKLWLFHRRHWNLNCNPDLESTHEPLLLTFIISALPVEQ